MDNQWRSIPGGVILTALALLTAASFAGLLAPPAAVSCSPVRPADDSQFELESPNNRRCPDADCSC